MKSTPKSADSSKTPVEQSSNVPESGPTPKSGNGILEITTRHFQQNPIQIALVGLLGFTIWYFFFHLPLFSDINLWRWASVRWKPEYNQEHGWLVLPLFAFLVYWHWDKLTQAKIQPSNWGLAVIGVGVVIFLMGIRTLQARLAMVALPFFVGGALLYLFGRHHARILLFATVMLLFMIPVGAIEQMTFRLQFLITGFADVVCNLIGINVYSVGTTLHAADGTFGFEIAEGCSGIRSLIAMIMVTGVFVHLTQKSYWKKGVIFAASVIFAIIGNAGRIVTIILFARYVDPEMAGGIYHDYSGFIFFPIAIGAMLIFAWLVNLNYGKLFKKPALAAESSGETATEDSKKSDRFEY